MYGSANDPRSANDPGTQSPYWTLNDPAQKVRNDLDFYQESENINNNDSQTHVWSFHKKYT